MSWLGRLMSRKRAGGEIELVELRSTRFRHLLRSRAAFLDLIADAADKQDGDYILDRQYPIALAERALDLADSVLFDLDVLSGDPHPALVSLLERQRDDLRRAVELGSLGDAAIEGDEEPEYRLLRRVRETLFTGTLPADGTARPESCITAWDVVELAHGTAAGALAALLDGGAGEGLAAVDIDLRGGHRLAVVDLGGAFEERGEGRTDEGATALRNRALAAFRTGLESAEPGRPVTANAAATETHAFIAARGNGGLLVVDATWADDPEIGHVYARAGTLAGTLLQGATRSFGAGTAWIAGAAPDRLREVLETTARLAAGAPGVAG